MQLHCFTRKHCRILAVLTMDFRYHAAGYRNHGQGDCRDADTYIRQYHASINRAALKNTPCSLSNMYNVLQMDAINNANTQYLLQPKQTVLLPIQQCCYQYNSAANYQTVLLPIQQCCYLSNSATKCCI